MERPACFKTGQSHRMVTKLQFLKRIKVYRMNPFFKDFNIFLAQRSIFIRFEHTCICQNILNFSKNSFKNFKLSILWSRRPNSEKFPRNSFINFKNLSKTSIKLSQIPQMVMKILANFAENPLKFMEEFKISES